MAIAPLGKSTTTTSPAPTASPAPRPPEGTVPAGLRADPAFQSFWLLRIGFTALPILFGADKFAHLMTNWDRYLAPRVDRIVPGTTHQAMYVVGVVEIIAGLVVLFAPRMGSYVVALWLAGIIVDLLLIPGYYDVAARDFGLLLAALTLARLSSAFPEESAPFALLRKRSTGPSA